MLATTLTLLTAANGLAIAKDGEGAAKAPSKAISERGAAPADKAAKPRDQRRQSDHRSSNDVSPGNSERGAGPDHDIRPGSRLPSPYHNDRHYVVDDWRAHRLSAPPRGHHWVQTGADYVLVAIVSGVVVQVLVVE